MNDILNVQMLAEMKICVIPAVDKQKCKHELEFSIRLYFGFCSDGKITSLRSEMVSFARKNCSSRGLPKL